MNYNYFMNQGNVVWVQGLEGARSYLIAPNSSVILLDSERQVFYLKSADMSGMPLLKVFDYSEHQDERPAYVTRDELENILSRLEKRDEQPEQHD